MSAMMSYKDVADRYNVTIKTIQNWVAIGEFPKPIKIGQTVRWRADDIQMYEERRSEKS
jgi:predicted DNA-binding transcriptional regulator AlpA